MITRYRSGVLAVCLFVVGFILAGSAPPPASAHAFLQRALPVNGTVVASNIGSVRLTFNERVEVRPERVTVTGSDGQRYDLRDAHAAPGDPLTVVVSLPQLPNGVYTVRYALISSDTHPITGTLRFGVGVTPAEVLGTASFYEMFKREPVGRYKIDVCTNISCQVLGAWELLEHAEHKLGVHPGGTTEDGLFTLEDVECLAACTEAPCLQVNYRYRYRVTAEDFDRLVDDLADGRLDDEVPPHGVLQRVRQKVAPERWAGNGAEGLPVLPGRGRQLAVRAENGKG